MGPEDWQATTLINRAGKVLDALEQAAADVAWAVALPPYGVPRIIGRVQGVVSDLQELMTQEPPGDPGALQSLADDYRRQAATARRATAELERVGRGDLPDAVVGRTGTALVDVLEALTGCADDAATGLDRTADVLDDLASDVRDAQTVHAEGRGTLAAAVSTLLGAPSWNPVEAVSDLQHGVRLGIDGVTTCRRAHERHRDALFALRRGWSDAAGYARLADADVPAGWTVVDVAVARWQGLGGPDDAVLSGPEWTAFVAAHGELSAADRRRWDELLARVTDPTARALLMSALATGAPVSAVEALGEALSGYSAGQLAELADLGLTSPSADGTVRFGGVRLDQFDQTTCGSTALLVLAARSDPFLALWLRTGERVAGWDPPFLQNLDAADWALGDVDARLTRAQQAMKDTTNAGGLGPVDWPGGIGTPPWGAVRGAGHSGVAYEDVMVDDQDTALLQDTLTRAAEAANAGTPVPLYSGGNVGDGVDAALPRHVVLVTGYSDGVYQVYEPSGGRTHAVPENELLDGGGEKLEALGNFRHVTWAVLPRS